MTIKALEIQKSRDRVPKTYPVRLQKLGANVGLDNLAQP